MPRMEAHIVSPTLLTAPEEGKIAVSRRYSALETAFYSFSRSKQPLIK